jgi:hypothetical protein
MLAPPLADGEQLKRKPHLPAAGEVDQYRLLARHGPISRGMKSVKIMLDGD